MESGSDSGRDGYCPSKGIQVSRYHDQQQHAVQFPRAERSGEVQEASERTQMYGGKDLGEHSRDSADITYPVCAEHIGVWLAVLELLEFEVKHQAVAVSTERRPQIGRRSRKNMPNRPAPPRNGGGTTCQQVRQERSTDVGEI